MKNKFLTEEFLTKMKESTPPFTELGDFVRLRTYSRFIDDLGRRETWLETVSRVCEYSVSLVKDLNPLYSDEKLREEAEFMFESMYMLKTFSSGRSLWVSGQSVGTDNPLSNFNCSFTTIEKFNDFKEIFLLSMLGSGIGIRILPEDVEKLPKIRNNVKLEHKVYTPVEKKLRKEYTELTFKGNTAIITIGDSKAGWSQSIPMYFDILSDTCYRNIDSILVNYDNVRPKGEKLKHFGGRASGHSSLFRMFKKIHKVTSASNGKLRPIDVLDICNIIGENVVSGGVRRTAQIILFDINDTDVLNAKSNLYIQNKDGNWESNAEILHRRMSNNSIYFKEKPSREVLHKIMQSIKISGEPGFINSEASKIRRGDFEGCNPCGEILLRNKGCCNLTTTNLMAFIDENNILDIKALESVIRLSVRIGFRMTLPHLEMENWDNVHQNDRLLGVSFTGYQDMVNVLGLSMNEQKEFLKNLREVAHAEAKRYSSELGLNAPLLVTTIKPEGTISTLPSVSSGIHFSHSPYYLRRVRVSSTDPLVKVAEELGYPVHPETGQTLENCDTKVIEFPMKAPKGKTKLEINAIEQLEIYKMSMEYWTDHNTSITVHVRDNEWEIVEDWVYNNWDYIVGISFLSLDDNFYPLLPYESITKEEYEDRKSKMKPFDETLLQKYEFKETDSDITDDSCANGVCPVR